MLDGGYASLCAMAVFFAERFGLPVFIVLLSGFEDVTTGLFFVARERLGRTAGGFIFSFSH